MEKYLKAYLTYKQKYFRKTHDIEELIFFCKEVDPDFEKLDEIKTSELNKYAVEVRYPDELYFPGIEEAREALKIAKKTKEFVVNKLKREGIEFIK